MILNADKLKRLGEGNAVYTVIRTHNRAVMNQGISEDGQMAVWYTTKKTIYIKQ